MAPGETGTPAQERAEAGVTPEVRNLRLRGRMQGRRIVPYWSRAEIDARGDKFAAPVIAWQRRLSRSSVDRCGKARVNVAGLPRLPDLPSYLRIEERDLGDG